MGIFRLNQNDIEYFTLETNPYRTFSSNSSGIISGNVNIFPRASTIEKETEIVSSASYFQENPLSNNLSNILNLSSSTNISDRMNAYLDTVHSQSISRKYNRSVSIIRFVPPVEYTKDTGRKSVVLNHLMPYYRVSYPGAHFGITNYNCLNFFTASGIPEDSVLLYPNSGSAADPVGYYAPSGAFSFDFWLKPSYTTDLSSSAFKAGTILHLSSCFAVSLITGSSKDINGFANGYRILLQLSHSANINPSVATPGTYPNNLIFLSDDNSLTKNNWHHITIRWGTSNYNLGSGSFVINGSTMGTFVIPSSSVKPLPFTTTDNPRMMCVGNYYEGKNAIASNLNGQVYFFTSDTAEREGIVSLVDGAEEYPMSYSFSHPLNAEVNELKIYNRYLTNTEIVSLDTNAPQTLDDLLFYVPPFFTQDSPTRSFVGTYGGVLTTPFFEEDGTTQDPFNIKMSYGVGGHYINLENYTKDFAQGIFPRLFSLTGSAITTTNTEFIDCDAYLYATGTNRRRAYTILPCDNGNFYPNYSLLKDYSRARNLSSGEMNNVLLLDKFKNDLGNQDLSFISLRNLISTSSYKKGLPFNSGTMFDGFAGASPGTNLRDAPGDVLTILQRTRDTSSNQVVFFDISNLYYGNQIKPGTFTITDTSLSSSSGKISITIKDDGKGNLYRANSNNGNATYNTVGTIFYNEGLILISHPSLYFFGKTNYSLSFQGVSNIHTITYNLYAKAGLITSSSNPTYLQLSASNNTNEKYVYISDLLVLDDNLNLINKTTMAQPILKKTGEKFLFKVKTNY